MGLNGNRRFAFRISSRLQWIPLPAPPLKSAWPLDESIVPRGFVSDVDHGWPRFQTPIVEKKGSHYGGRPGTVRFSRSGFHRFICQTEKLDSLRLEPSINLISIGVIVGKG